MIEMKRRNQKMSMAIAAALGSSALAPWALAATTAYSDNFNRATLNGGTYTYTPTFTGDGGAVTDGSVGNSGANELTLTNDASATANTNGLTYVSTPTSAYGGGFNQVLDSNGPNALTWTFNMQQIRANPAGLSSGTYGAAYVLGGTDAALATAGNGYAIVFGNTGATDPVRLIKYTGGLNTVGTGANALAFLSGGTNVGSDFWSVKVTYDPGLDSWSLSTRNDGATFADPALPGGYIVNGTAVETTYTGVALTHSGTYWSYSTTANQTARFDNFNLELGPPPVFGTPRNLTWDGNQGTSPNPSDVSGTWEAANNWWDGAANTTWASSNPDNATFGSGTGSGTTTVTVGSPQTVGSITFAANSPTYTVTGSTLQLNGSSGAGVTANQSATLLSTISAAGAVTWNVASGATVTVGNGTSGGLTSSGGITKSGLGTVDFRTATGTYTGSLVINAGTVIWSGTTANGHSPAGTTVTINSGSTLQINGVEIGQNTPVVTTVVVNLNAGGTLQGRGTSRIRGEGSPVVPTSSGTNTATVNITGFDSSTVFTIDSTIRHTSGSTNAANALINVDPNGGRIILASGPTSMSPGGNQYRGNWELADGILQIGPSLPGAFGEPLNALGYTAAAGGGNGPGRPITIKAGGTLAVAVNSVNLQNTVPIDAEKFRARIILDGGAIASTQLDATYAGNITVQSDSFINTSDPVLGGARTVNIATQDNIITVPHPVNDGNITWNNAKLTVIGTGIARFQRTVLVNPGEPAGLVSVTPGATLQINSGATVQLAGTQNALRDDGGVNHVAVINNGTLQVETSKDIGSLSGTGPNTVSSGATLTVHQTAAGTARSVTGAGNLTVDGSNVLTISPPSGVSGIDVADVNVNGGTLKTTTSSDTAHLMNTVNTSGTGEFDVNGAGLIIKADTVTNVRAELLAGSGGAGFGAQTWDQPGINSSDAATDPLTYSVGYMDNDQFILGAKATFDGVSVPAASILVKSTLSGDADLDWDVDDDDVTVLGIFYGGPGHWYEGDFDYNGVVDDDDVTLLGITYGQSLPSAPGGVAAVPEPASLGMLGLAAAGLMRRRRRN